MFALAFERCSKPCFGPSEGVGGALAPAGGPNVRGCQPLSAAPGVTPGAPSPAAAPKKGTYADACADEGGLLTAVQSLLGEFCPSERMPLISHRVYWPWSVFQCHGQVAKHRWRAPRAELSSRPVFAKVRVAAAASARLQTSG